MGLALPEIIEKTEIEGDDTLREDPVEQDKFNLTMEEPAGNGTVKVENEEITEWPYEEEYENGTKVNLTADPDESWGFSYWGGTVPGSKRRDESINLTMDEDKEVRAYFGRRKLEINVWEGEGNVTVKWDGLNETIDQEDTLYFKEGTVVTLKAEPEESWGFRYWGGDVTGSKRREDIIELTMDDDKEVRAYFGRRKLEINVWEGKGNVTVIWDEWSESVHEKETFFFAEGANVTLEAEPDEGWGFNYWGGDIDASKRRDESVDLTMDDDKEVRAYFGTTELDIRIWDGEGNVTVRWGDDESHTVADRDTLFFAEGTNVTVEAEPDDGWTFKYWGGLDVPVSKRRNERINLTMDDDKMLPAYFLELFNLTVEKPVGEGQIFIADEQYTSDELPKNFTYEKGTEVELKVNVSDGWYFSHWREDYPENEERNESITITMDADKTIQAYFSKADYVEIYPDEDQIISAGEIINFTAVAYDKYNYTLEEDVTQFEWENIYEVNETENSAIFYMEETGEFEVTATYDNVTSESITVTVSPADPVEIWIEPGEETIIAGDSQGYTAWVEDEYGNELEVTEEATWSIDNEAGGEWDQENGIYTSEVAGEWVVEAEYNDKIAFANLEVQTGDADHIEISPEDETITAGDSQEYTATAYDLYGNIIGEVTEEIDWSDDIPDSSWDMNRITAYTEGTWEITGEYEGLEDTTTLTVESAEVYIVLIEPEEDQTIEAGETIEFSAEAYDEYDNMITDDDTEFTWENTDDSGLFDETEVGEYEVTADYEGVTSEPITVTVEAGDVDKVEIQPKENQTITAGEKIEFSVWANDTYGNVITDDPEDFNWENAPNGIFEKFEAGEYEVRAEYDDVYSEPVTVDNVSDVKPAMILLSVILTSVVGVAVYHKIGGEK